MPRMCAIGRDQITSIGAATGAATLLGSAPKAGSVMPGARRTSSGTSRTTYLGAPPAPPVWSPGNPPGTFTP